MSNEKNLETSFLFHCKRNFGKKSRLRQNFGFISAIQATFAQVAFGVSKIINLETSISFQVYAFRLSAWNDIEVSALLAAAPYGRLLRFGKSMAHTALKACDSGDVRGVGRHAPQGGTHAVRKSCSGRKCARYGRCCQQQKSPFVKYERARDCLMAKTLVAVFHVAEGAVHGGAVFFRHLRYGFLHGVHGADKLVEVPIQEVIVLHDRNQVAFCALFDG